MYRVEKLTPSKHINGRYYAEFDNAETIVITVDHIADYSIFTGRELTDEEYLSLVQDAQRSEAKARALRILGERNLSRREIIQRLIKKGESEEIAEETADWLEKIGAVNDEEYAVLIVRHYAGKGYGVSKIKDELYKRGIERDLWDDALLNMPDMEDKAYTLFCSKLRSDDPDRAEIKRATDALYRRGFSWDEIRAAVNRYESEKEGY